MTDPDSAAAPDDPTEQEPARGREPEPAVHRDEAQHEEPHRAPADPATDEPDRVGAADAVRPDLPTPQSTVELVAEPATRCLNCDAELPGPFCPACGQRAERLRQPVHLFLRDALAELFGLDGRVWRTLGTLLVKPGTLTLAYLRGRRRRYLTPLRVYLVATLTFFVLLSVLDPADAWLRNTVYTSNGEPADTLVQVRDLARSFDAELARIDSVRERTDAPESEASRDRIRERATRTIDSLTTSSRAGQLVDGIVLTDEARGEMIDDTVEAMLDSLDVPSPEDELRLRVERGIVGVLPPDSLVRPLDIDAAASQIVPDVSLDVADWMPEWLQQTRSVEQFSEARTSRDATDASRVLIRNAIGQIPTVFFLLLPIYALLLKVLYVRRDWFYAEHLVFALHVHAFTFTIGALVLVVASSGAWGAPVTAFYALAGLSIPVYFLIAQKRVYGQSWPKTIAKATVLGPSYAFLLTTAGIALTLALAVIRG